VYRACVAIIDEKEAETFGLPTWTIPGGKYAREKVTDYRSRVEVIAETFEAMAKEFRADRSRPEVEFYKSQREIILLLPIL
jgi:DNA gyrase inhibitor GyrI